MIALYAELLTNIGQVAVTATLPTEQNVQTKIALSSDRRLLSVSHDGQWEYIQLPCQIASTAILTVPAAKTKQISFRLQSNEDPRHSQDTVPVEPWMANLLKSNTLIACKACKTTVIKSTILTWKDLPSENWAEMMDFWHCHKPSSDIASTGSSNATKGYSAANRLRAQPGIGFVDSGHVIISTHDCPNLKSNEDATVRCPQCHAVLGATNQKFAGIMLDKWNIALQHAGHPNWEQYPAQNFVCAQLLELIQTQAIRKFLAHSGNSQHVTGAILLWVFNPNLRYSSSRITGGSRNAMKILYQLVADHKELLAQQAMSVEELVLPLPILAEVRANLESSAAILPKPARTLQGWQVGLLDMF